MHDDSEHHCGRTKTAVRNISKKALCPIERRRGLYKNYLSDISYENKRNVNIEEKALKYELRKFEVEVVEKMGRSGRCS